MGFNLREAFTYFAAIAEQLGLDGEARVEWMNRRLKEEREQQEKLRSEKAELEERKRVEELEDRRRKEEHAREMEILEFRLRNPNITASAASGSDEGTSKFHRHNQDKSTLESKVDFQEQGISDEVPLMAQTALAVEEPQLLFNKVNGLGTSADQNEAIPEPNVDQQEWRFSDEVPPIVATTVAAEDPLMPLDSKEDLGAPTPRKELNKCQVHPDFSLVWRQPLQDVLWECNEPVSNLLGVSSVLGHPLQVSDETSCKHSHAMPLQLAKQLKGDLDHSLSLKLAKHNSVAMEKPTLVTDWTRQNNEICPYWTHYVFQINQRPSLHLPIKTELDPCLKGWGLYSGFFTYIADCAEANSHLANLLLRNSLSADPPPGIANFVLTNACLNLF